MTDTAKAPPGVVARARKRLASTAPTALTFYVLLALYLALTVAILFRTPVLDLDQAIINRALPHNYPQYYPFVYHYVALGQRRLVTQVALPLLILISWRTRSARPLVMLVVALVTLNVSIGVVKVATGRIGPRGGHPVDMIFAGGDIYPSGHVSNVVVMYGLMAIVASRRIRPLVVAIAAFICLTVGAGTLYLNTHWLTDVIGGWLAGGLVLCALPWLTPLAERVIRLSYSPTRAFVSIAGGTAALYLSMNWLTRYFGSSINDVFGGWLAAGLFLSIVPWLTPPLERVVVRAIVSMRDRLRPAKPATPALPDPPPHRPELVGSAASKRASSSASSAAGSPAA